MHEPATARGRRTANRLLIAARSVFEERGFLDARVVDVVDRAGVSVGTFYTYFESMADAFSAVISEVSDEVYLSGHVGDKADNWMKGVRIANRRFIDVYSTNARLIGVIEQAATIDDGVRQKRLAMRRRMVDRVARAIEELQGEGQVKTELDSQCAASALVSMVSNFAYSWLVIGEEFDPELAVETLTGLWIGALSCGSPPCNAVSGRGV